MKKLIWIILPLLMSLLPASATTESQQQTLTLRDLKNELHTSCVQIPWTQEAFTCSYQQNHQRMLDIISTSNNQSILLYTQEPHATFNMAYVLRKVTSEYNTFHREKQPFDKDIETLNFQIERYTRLIESLQQMPPQMVETLSDSVLAYRDSCIIYATELLRMYEANHAQIMSDSTHYQEAYTRLKQNHDYAEVQYRNLQKYIFHDGQTPFITIVRNFGDFKEELKAEIRKQYDLVEMTNPENVQHMHVENISGMGAHLFLLVLFAILLVALGVFWGFSYFIVWLIYRFTPKHRLDRKQLPLLSIFIGSLLYICIFNPIWDEIEYVKMGVGNINTFLWLLIAFAGSMLLRVKPEEIRPTSFIYLPLFVIAFVIILARNTFVPDGLLVLIFPPLMLLIIIRQLVGCLWLSGKVPAIDSQLGWASLGVYVLTFIFAFGGYTFIGLLIFVWWYFQLAVLLSVICVSELLNRYKHKRLDERIAALRERITYVSGEERESLLFGATWLYDFIREVAVPAMVIISLPLCARLSLNIFDFNDLFVKYYTQPFVSLTNEGGVAFLCISIRSIVYLAVLFLILRYLNRAVHALWQYFRYMLFMRKNNRTSIRANEVNLSLGNSIITVIIWMSYVIVVFVEWKIPTGSLGLVAGGLSAGVGLALKDVINNFIYGLQLVGGKLRVGDWIECDGVRGKVTSINYQCVQVETLDGTETSFLNSSLFGKNFNNLTRNNSYERIIIYVRIAYGTDMERVRAVLLEGMKQVHTKDRYGREVIEPGYDINIAIQSMSESAVIVAIKQFVLVAEQLPYYDRAKEAIYNSLNAAGIHIPYPQCDVHLMQE